tara:strand:- start:206 stop:322 length:117 start_codon:yes stop_codon:yes gene_type:complete
MSAATQAERMLGSAVSEGVNRINPSEILGIGAEVNFSR